MKKRLISLLLILLLLAALFPAALAEDAGASEDAAPEETAAAFPYVLDNAGLLRDSQRETLEQKAAALSEQHQCSLYIVTVEDYTTLDRSSIRLAVKGIQSYYSLGTDTGGNVVILMLSMKERDYWAEGFGEKGNALYSAESSWLIEDEFLDNFRNDDWYGGFSDFLDACDTQLTKYENGEDLDEGADIITGPDGLDYHSYNDPYQNTGRSLMPRLLVVIFVPLVVALVVCLIFKGQMKTAKLATRADEYLVPHSMNLRIRDDVFTHRTESRTLIESDSGSRGGGGGGGGSFHVSGGGSSGRGGKF